MSGGADARLELQGGLPLEAIQARHRFLRGLVELGLGRLAGRRQISAFAAEHVFGGPGDRRRELRNVGAIE
jgi:hypothetical protein